MNKQFVPYELALKLKELGFDEECLGAFTNKGIFNRCTSESWNNDSLRIIREATTCNLQVLAPLWQQAFDWFREKHNLHSYLSPKVKYPDNTVDDNEYYYTIVGDNKDYGDDGVRSYEESKLTCLEQLIQIIKKDKK